MTVIPHKHQVCQCGDHAFAAVPGGHVVLVSPEDAWLLRWSWKAARRPNGYIQICRDDGRRTLTLSREILPPPDGLQVDHRNGDSIDNRRPNLRVCTPRENAFNRRAERGAKVPFKGVSLRSNGTYQASICVAGKRTYLGCFKSAELAHQAYSEAATRLHGEFARVA